MNVLLVEDDPSCVKMIQQALNGFTKRIDVTDKLAVALEMLSDEYNAVWLDAALTDSNSEDTIAAIPKIKEKCPMVTLLVVSGYGEKYREEALRLGADAYASKLDLKGFQSPLIANLFIEAATHAMSRGVDASFILQRVALFLQGQPRTQCPT